MDGVPDPVALVVIVAAVAAGTITKGVTGLGLPLIAVPVLATFLGVEQAVVIMALPTTVSNAWMVWAFRTHLRDTQRLPMMLSTGTVGTVLGVLALTNLPAAGPTIALGAVVLGYLVVRLRHPQLALRPTTVSSLTPTVGMAGGLFQGALGISGPVIATFYHGARLAQGPFVLSVSAVFGAFAFVQICTLAVLGRYDTSLVVGSVLAMVPMAVVFPLAMRLGRRIAPERFERVVLAVLFAMGVKLLYDGISALA